MKLKFYKNKLKKLYFNKEFLTKQFSNFYSEDNIINTNQKDYFKTFVELRSDVKTLPTLKMKESVLYHNYGDDIFNEDPTISLLYDKLCSMFKSKAALFCSSGTMANMISLHLKAKRNEFIIIGSISHISIIERDQLEFYGFNVIRLDNLSDGSMCIEYKYVKEQLIKANIIDYIIQKLPSIKSLSDIIKVICLEDTHNFCGGKVLDYKFINKLNNVVINVLKDIIKDILMHKNINYNDYISKIDCKMQFHLDGSRIFNSSVKSNNNLNIITNEYDSINICLSKGLGAPVGSVLLLKNKNDFQKAKFYRKILGGNMRQAGFLAAPALVALEDYKERLYNDHINANMFEDIVLNNCNKFNNHIGVDFKCETNIVNLYINTKYKSKMNDFVTLLREKHKILINSYYPNYFRIVFHHQVNKKQTEYAAIHIAKEAQNMLL